MPSSLPEKLKYWLDNPDSTLDADTIAALRRDFPFFVLPEAESLRMHSSSLSPGQRQAIAERIALSLSSPQAAQQLVDPASAPDPDFYPHTTAQHTPDTFSAIDTFLSTYGSESSEEISVLEKLIFNPVADYSQQLARREQSEAPSAAPTGDDRTDRINRFILSHREPDSDPIPLSESTPTTTIGEHSASSAPAASSTPPASSTLSESLAKIYIKTGRYERAYEILSRISLAVPEKNAYFADQLRFLRKLMRIQQLTKPSDQARN